VQAYSKSFKQNIIHHASRTINMDTWRLIPLETNNAFMNMAIDEAILTAHIAKRVPDTLRFYQWKPSAVSIGKNQNSQDEVYQDNARKHSVDIVRRISGGGAVYHDQNREVTYSVVSKTEKLGGDITTVYHRIYEAVTDALRLMGVPADFSPGDTKNCPNLMVGNRKISGSSQTIKRGTVLQHGTILLDIDLHEMFRYLRVRSTSSCSQATQIATRKITSIKTELHHSIAVETVANALAQGFRAMLKINLEPAKLTTYEMALAEKLFKEKYSTDMWNQNGKTT
jgi:lipoate---protein ligase